MLIDILIQLEYIHEKINNGEMTQENMSSFEEQYPILKTLSIMVDVIIYGTLSLIGIVIFYFFTH